MQKPLLPSYNTCLVMCSYASVTQKSLLDTVARLVRIHTFDLVASLLLTEKNILSMV